MNLVDKLRENRILSKEEFIELLSDNSDETINYLRETAVKIRKEVYNNHIYIRGLIEISNFCKNDCFYCGIRKSNKNCQRYRLTKEDILTCCENGYKIGFRTFVLQGGEDKYYSDEILCDIIIRIMTQLIGLCRGRYIN